LKWRRPPLNSPHSVNSAQDPHPTVASNNDLTPSRDSKRASRAAAEQDVLLREVDDAVRQDQLGNAARKYALPIGIGLLVALAAFGGWLIWQESRESAVEQRSETLVTAFDALEARQFQQAQEKLAPLAREGTGAAGAAAKLGLAGLALQQNRSADAFRQYEALIADEDAPQSYRDVATIRLVAGRFDDLPPQQVIDRLKPLAAPGNPWFGSAGELVAMAYLKQGREDLAGPLLAAIAKDDEVPQTIRSRTRQLAGLLGYDAVEDVDQTMAELQQEQAGARAPAAPAPAP
jgi:hypothetical protein